jgi:hypothetical protein
VHTADEIGELLGDVHFVESYTHYLLQKRNKWAQAF